jgi:hypothetical protein
MYPQQHFKLTPVAAILATALGAFPVTGYCVAAGRADFVIGNVEAVAADGTRRTLAKGSEINTGEAIDTALGARAQIRFTDGGYVSLQPNTQFRVDDYSYENKTDGKEKGFFSLLKGGLRAITGAIGHVNRNTYRVATKAATIGIRGTGYNAMLGEGLSISVADGIISLTNKGGSLILSQGQSAFVADFNTAPSLTFEKPATPPAGLSGTAPPPPKEEQYVAGNDTGGGGSLPNAGLTVLTGVAAVATGFGFGGSGPVVDDADYPGIVVFNSFGGSNVYYIQASPPAGAVTDFTGATLATGISGTDSVDTAMLGYTYSATGISIPASGYDGIVGWGRYYGTVSYTEPGLTTITNTFTPDQGGHFVVGMPTAVMPTVGSAHYALTGATAPTLSSGAVAPGTVTGGGVDVWFSGTPELYGKLNLAIGGYNYGLTFSGTFSGNGIGPGGTIISSANSSNSGCTNGCTASTSGFFAGANAERGGVAYRIDNNMLGSPIHGAAVYTKTASSALSTPPSGW